MTGYICYVEVRGQGCVGMFPTREQAERRCQGAGVAEVNASHHVQALTGPVYFRPTDQSYPQLLAELVRTFGGAP